MATLGEFVGSGSGTTKLLLHLNGNSTDSSGNGNNLTNNNSVSFNASKFGLGADFGSSNTNKYLSYVGSNNNVLGFNYNTNNITMSAWVNITTAPTSGNQGNIFFFQIHNTAGTSRSFYRLYYKNNGGTLQLFSFTSGLSYNVTLTTGTWYHIVWTVDSSNNHKLYLNNSEVSSVATTDDLAGASTPVYNSFSIGASKYEDASNPDPLSGKIDEVIIENRAWSASEVKKYYTYAKGQFALN